MLESVRSYCQSHALLACSERMLVGFSGGPDSTALLLILQELKVEQVAVHFHHGLRDAADADADWCRSFCEQRGIPFVMQRLDVHGQKRADESIEMGARRSRLAGWKQLVTEGRGQRVALGHHRDDVIETVLMRLFRGANASGLSGLRPYRKLMGIPFVRPLLQTSRVQIEQYLSEHEIEALHDASNDDSVYRRNRVRHELLPLIDACFGRDGIAKSADYLLGDAVVLEGLADCGADLTVVDLRSAKPALRLRMLRSWAAAVGHGCLTLGAGSAAKLHQVLDGSASSEQKLVEVDENRVLVLDHDQLQLVGSADLERPVLPVTHWNWQQESVLALADGRTLKAEFGGADATWDLTSVVFDARELPCPLIVRGREPGDRMIPFGEDQLVRVKKILGNTKCTLAERQRALIVTNPGGTILWLAPVRRSNLYRVTEDTGKTVRLELG